MSDEEIVLGTIEKKDKTLKYSIRYFKGNKYLDIRVFFKNGKGHMVPTKEGITIGARHLDEHQNLLNLAKYHLRGEQPF